MKIFLTTISIWTGAVIGVLTVVDWLLLDSQKKRLQKRSEDAWLWLASQRLGRFTVLLKSRKTQIGFSIAAHLMMIFIVLAFIARIYWGVNINAQLELGHPRIYRFQVWVDILALLVSMFVVSWVIHPRVAYWISNSTSMKRYFLKTFAAFIICFILMGVILLLEYPIIGFNSPAFNARTEAELITQYEQMLGGKIGVIIVHALTATVVAPIMAETILLQVILFLSVYWFIFVLILMTLFKISQFILIRIVESPKGPVLGISGLLVGIGALVKAFL